LAPLLAVKSLAKSFLSGTKTIHVIRNLDFQVQQGELLAVVGRSGCGKTTLLNLVAGLDRPDHGQIAFDGEDLTAASETTWSRIRRDKMGFVFQFNQLLPEFTALENAAMPGLIARRDRQQVFEKARDLLRLMGLNGREDHEPARLSGGEQQRVAIARALMNEPRLLLADEPTGNLDLQSARTIFDMLNDIQARLGISCLLVTHNPELAHMCGRIFDLSAAQNGSDPSAQARGLHV